VIHWLARQGFTADVMVAAVVGDYADGPRPRRLLSTPLTTVAVFDLLDAPY